MRLIKDLFPDKIMKMQEGANMLISLLLKVSFIKAHMAEKPFAGKKNILKIVLGVFVCIGCLIYELAKKVAYIWLMMWIPWKILGNLCPLISRQQNLTIIYMYFILSTLCGTITNTTIFTLSPRDSFLLDTAGVKASRYYFGRIIYRMFVDVVFGGTALALLGVVMPQAFLLALVTGLARPVGEAAGLVIFTFFRKLHKKKALYDGVIIAIAMIIAYACPFAFRKISPVWNVVTGPVMITIVALFSAMSLYIVWNYNRYGSIVRELIFSKREDFN